MRVRLKRNQINGSVLGGTYYNLYNKRGSGEGEGVGAYQVLEPPLSVEFDYIERERSLQVALRLLSFSEKRRETVLQLTTRNFIANNTRTR